MVGSVLRRGSHALLVILALIVAGCAGPVPRAVRPLPANTSNAASPLSSGVTQSSPATAPASTLAALSGPSVYWGAYVAADIYGLSVIPPRSMKAVDLFEAHAGRGLSILHWGHPWFSDGNYYRFDAALMENVRLHGALSLLDWTSEDHNVSPEYNQPALSLATIINGTHDAYIRQWATDARAWGHPFFLRFDYEMNGDRFPWSELQNGNSSGQFVQAWRHVHDIFAQTGATNVTWVWCPNVEASGPIPLAGLYPGDAYVDWTCTDGYNWGTNPTEPDGWITFSNLFGPTYNHILTLAPSKPMMLGEVSCTESGGSKANWITDALATQLPQNFPKIKALVWMNAGGAGQDWPVESSTSAKTAFSSALASGYYATNSFATLTTAPIPPPNGSIPPAALATLTSAPTATRMASPPPAQTEVTAAIAVPTPSNAAAATRVPAAAVTPVGQTGSWKVIFDDEFNGSTLDPTHWQTCYPWQTGTCSNAANGEVELYNPDDVLVDQGAGILRLRAQKRDMVGWNGQTFHYTSGIVTTGGIQGQQAPGFAYTYGYAEARVKVPKGQGLWPAFWAAPTDYVWPPEIDIMEILGQQPTVDNMIYHWTDSGGIADYQQSSSWTGPDFSAGYHVLGMDWTKHAIVWYVDGVERARHSTAANIYDQPMYLVLNLAVEGWAGPLDPSTPFPSYFDIDYVRVWQRAG